MRKHAMTAHETIRRVRNLTITQILEEFDIALTDATRATYLYVANDGSVQRIEKVDPISDPIDEAYHIGYLSQFEEFAYISRRKARRP